MPSKKLFRSLMLVIAVNFPISVGIDLEKKWVRKREQSLSERSPVTYPDRILSRKSRVPSVDIFPISLGIGPSSLNSKLSFETQNKSKLQTTYLLPNM